MAAASGSKAKLAKAAPSGSLCPTRLDSNSVEGALFKQPAPDAVPECWRRDIHRQGDLDGAQKMVSKSLRPPGINGGNLARALKVNNPQLKIIAPTGQATETRQTEHRAPPTLAQPRQVEDLCHHADPQRQKAFAREPASLTNLFFSQTAKRGWRCRTGFVSGFRVRSIHADTRAVLLWRRVLVPGRAGR